MKMIVVGVPTSLKTRSGFTLIEMLLVCSLIPIIFFAAFSNFLAGYSIWEKVQVRSPIENISIFSKKLSKDLHPAFPYQGWQEEWLPDSITFNSYILADPKLGGRRGIGQIRYYFDPNKKAIFREIKDLNVMYKEKAGVVSLALDEVLSVQFLFFSMDTHDKKYYWKEDWDVQVKGSPLAIRLNMAMVNGDRHSLTYELSNGGVRE